MWFYDYPACSEQIQPKLLPLAFFIVLFPCTYTQVSGFLEYIVFSVKYIQGAFFRSHMF